MKKWKCGACGYIYTGGDPPENCPVCGAPNSRFAEIPAPGEETVNGQDGQETSGLAAAAHLPEPEPVSPFANSPYRRLFEMLTKYHGHPISVHIPNGLLPVAVLFIFLSALFGVTGMARAAIYDLGVVAIAMPLVMFSGWVDWQNRFNGAITRVFMVKFACGIIVSVTAWFLFIWLLINPAVITAPHPSRLAFFMINFIMLGAAATAGWYGGKLVFKD